MKKRIYLIGLLFLAIFTISCSNSNKPKDFDYGSVVNNKYTNSFFDMEISLPSDWVVQTKEQTENLVKQGKEIVAGDDKNLKAVLNASEINSANLMVMFQFEVGAAVEYNPNFMLVAENIKNFPGIKNGSDYLYQARKLIVRSQLQYDSIDEEFTKVTINNTEFYTMNAILNVSDVGIRQTYYSTILNGFCISAIISYINDEQKAELEKVINSISFKK